MNFTAIPSLQHQAFVKLTYTLWNQRDIQALMASNRSISLKPTNGLSNWSVSEFTEAISLRTESTEISRRRDEWKLLENKVQEKVARLPLPDALKKETRNFTRLVGEQVLNWSLYHEFYLGILVKDCLNNLCWTFLGTIDGKKTAERLIEARNLHVTLLYRLACSYCLEDHVCTLWAQINREEFYGKDLEEISYHEPYLIAHWSSYAEGKPCYYYDSRMFHYAASCGNLSAASYFIKKLASSLQPSSMGVVLSSMQICSCDTKILVNSVANIWCLVFCHMNQEQMVMLLERDSYRILSQFLVWPYQNAFICIVQHFQNFLRDRDIYSLLIKISREVEQGYSHYEYKILFGVFWRTISCSHKKYAIERCGKEFDLLLPLFAAESWENIQLVLKAAKAEGRRKIIFSSCGMKICTHLVYFDKWDLFRLFTKECLSSKGNVLHLKEKITVHLNSEEFMIRDRKWEIFHQFFHDLILSY